MLAQKKSLFVQCANDDCKEEVMYRVLGVGDTGRQNLKLIMNCKQHPNDNPAGVMNGVKVPAIKVCVEPAHFPCAPAGEFCPNSPNYHPDEVVQCSTKSCPKMVFDHEPDRRGPPLCISCRMLFEPRPPSPSWIDQDRRPVVNLVTPPPSPVFSVQATPVFEATPVRDPLVLKKPPVRANLLKRVMKAENDAAIEKMKDAELELTNEIVKLANVRNEIKKKRVNLKNKDTTRWVFTKYKKRRVIKN